MDKFVQVNIYILAFYLLYRFAFRLNPSFIWNRIYLLFMIPLAVFLVILPELLPQSAGYISIGFPVYTVFGGDDLLTVFSFNDASEVFHKGSNINLFWWVYGFVSALLLGYYVWLHFQLRIQLLGEEKEMDGKITILRSKYFTQAFSYFNYLILPKKLEDSDEYELIIRHEKTHIRQRHSYDLLLLQLLSVLFWFNPVSWLLIREMKMVHEFLADQKVLKQQSIKQQYIRLLLKESLSMPQFYIVNRFNYSSLKFRIIMMKKSKTSSNSKFIYLLILPLLFGLSTISFAQNKGARTTITSASKKVKGVVNFDEGGEVFTVVDEPPQFPGGQEALLAFLGRKIKYPKKAKKAGVEGIVFVNFVIEKDGGISNVQVMRGIGSGCDKESMRVVRKMPKWKPGKQRGKKVRVKFTLPIKYKLKKEKVYTKVEEPASFIGGQEALMNFLKENIHYPDEAMKKEIEGTVNVSFIVEKDGSLSEIFVVRGVSYSLDIEAMRLVRIMPKWKPGRNNGSQVRMRMTLPIQFNLQ